MAGRIKDTKVAIQGSNAKEELEHLERKLNGTGVTHEDGREVSALGVSGHSAISVGNFRADEWHRITHDTIVSEGQRKQSLALRANSEREGTIVGSDKEVGLLKTSSVKEVNNRKSTKIAD